MHQQAYSTFDIKSIDEEQRVIIGIASTPEVDRGGDELDPKGARFVLPMPFKWKHTEVVGEVFAANVTSAGIEIKARIVKVAQPGLLKDIVDFAWQSIQHKLARGLSVGWHPLEAVPNRKGGLKASVWEWVETSAVPIPMNALATITNIKSLDTGAPKSGSASERHDPSAEAPAFSPSRRGRSMKKSISERVTQYKAERKTIADKMKTLMQPVLDEDGELTREQQKEYDDLSLDLKSTDADIVRFESLEQAEIMPKAQPVRGQTSEEGAESRGRRFAHGEGQAKSVLPPGIEFTRFVICKAAARIFGVSPLDVARERFPDQPRIQTMLKAAVAGGTTTDATWAAPLLQDVTTLTGEFLEYLRPMTIIGRFGTGGIPSLTRVPFYSRVQSQTSGGVSNWVGQAIQKPVTKFDYAAITLNSAKVAAISVLSDELIRFSNPAAEGRVRDSLAGIIVERLDRDFIDPDKAIDANVSPASITNGITGLTPSSGGDPDDVRTDIAALMGAFISAHQNPANLVWIMSNTSALQLSLMRNALGQREFPEVNVKGGSFEGFPVIASQYAAVVGSPTQNIVILVNPSEIFLADDGGVTVDMSNEATIEMSDDPVNDTGTQQNMFQTNQVALRAERFINWARGRTSSVAWLDGAAWSASA